MRCGLARKEILLQREEGSQVGTHHEPFSPAQRKLHFRVDRFSGHPMVRGVKAPERSQPWGETHPPYAKEFRAEAARLVRESGKSLAVIAKDLVFPNRPYAPGGNRRIWIAASVPMD